MSQKKLNSSGAEKAEKLALANKEGADKSKSASKNTGADNKNKSTVKSKKTKSAPRKQRGEGKGESAQKKAKAALKETDGKSLKREKKQERKLEKARLAAEKVKAKLEKKLAYKQKREERKAFLKQKKEERKLKREELKAQRRERRDVIKHENKEERRARIASEKNAKREAKKAKREAYLADKKAKREHALKVRAERRAARSERRHSPGVGGWIAGVVSLGVTTLALGTIVTFGAITMDGMQADVAAGYTQSLYELNAVVDNLDANLARARASSSVADRVKVFSDIAIEAETAETILERFPLDMQMTGQFTSFVNKMGDSAKDMLYTVANGGSLSPSQEKALEYMYKSNKKLKGELNELVTVSDGRDMLEAMRGKVSSIGDGFTVIENNTFETPKGIQDGPFSDSLTTTNPRALEGQKEITAPKAEKIAAQMFASYKPTGARCTGEATASQLTVYNVSLDTPDGEMFVQLSKTGGRLVAFDSFKDCAKHNFSVDRCIDIAEDFLSSVGYKNMKAVWASENGTVCNLNFAPVSGETVLYPDLVKVKVCEERGIVTGVEALSFVLNHGKRALPEPAVSESQARGEINGNVLVKASRLALIPLDEKEILCYEFFGELDGNEYFIYVDATTCEEVEVLTVVGTAQGKAIM